MKLSKGRKRSIKEWCSHIEPGNEECGEEVKDLFDLGEF